MDKLSKQAPAAPPQRPADLDARNLLRGASKAALASIERGTGEPYVSLVLIATDPGGAPVLLISALAQHTQNLVADPRASLLVETPAAKNPLAEARLTVTGVARPTDDPHVRTRFLARHPQATEYAGFKDFAFYRLEPSRGHFIGGFGRIVPLPREALIVTGWEPLAAAEADIVAHMNADHADALALYADQLQPNALQTGVEAHGAWRMTGIDTEGTDLARDDVAIRVPFAQSVHSAEAARAELVRLAKAARAAPGN